MKTSKSILIVVLFFVSGIAYSQSGWIKVTDSVPRLWLESIQMTSANTGYACGAYFNNLNDNLSKTGIEYYLGAILKTTNGGLNWQRTDYVNFNVDDVSFLNDLTGYFIGWAMPVSGYYSGHILKTTDGGLTWTRHDSIQNGNFFRIKFRDVNTGMIAGKYGSALLTTNGGVNWINISSGLNGWMEPQFIWSLDANIWFVGDGQRLSKTTNQGLNWIRDDSLPAGSMHFFNGNTGIIGDKNGFVYKTTNAGANWTKIYNISLGWAHQLTFTDNNTGYYVRYGYYNIFKTTNGGYNWFEQNVNSMDVISSVNFLNNLTGYAAGTSGRIFMTTNGGSVFVSNISNEVPEKFELGQNYPNPFNQSTIFNFQCSMKSDVTVKVFDAAGREVQTLVNETLAPGTYRVRFDGSGLASGLYYYRMSVDGKQTAVKKMVMIK